MATARIETDQAKRRQEVEARLTALGISRRCEWEGVLLLLRRLAVRYLQAVPLRVAVKARGLGNADNVRRALYASRLLPSYVFTVQALLGLEDSSDRFKKIIQRVQHAKRKREGGQV